MPDETKSPTPRPPENEKPTADRPATPGGVRSTPSGSVQPETTTTPAKRSPPSKVETPPKAATPTAPPASPKPAAPTAEKPAAAAVPERPAGPPAPPKPAGPAPTPWDSPMVAKLKQEYGSAINPLTHLGQNYMEVDRSLIPE